MFHVEHPRNQLLPLGPIAPFVDLLGGVTTYSSQSSNPSPYTSSKSPAIALDGGVDLRLIGPLAARIQGGFLHDSFTTTSPILQPYVHTQHGRLLVEAVWRF